MKLTPEAVQVIVTFLVGGGLATLVTQIARAVSSMRTGARATTREVVKDLAESRDNAEGRLSVVQRDLEYWRNIAGGYSYQMRQAGIIPDPPDPCPPSTAIGRGSDTTT